MFSSFTNKHKLIHLFNNNNQRAPFKTVRTASTICSVLGNAIASRLNAYGVGTSTPDTLYTGASKYLNAPLSIISAIISADIPDYGHPSSTHTNLPVFLTLSIIVSLSNGLSERKLTTSQLIPSLNNYSAALNENSTILENATIVT